MYGFLTGKSTSTNLGTVTQYISKELDKDGQVDIIYTDFSSAFDRVDHNLLLNKPSFFGMSPSFIKLIESYLVA